MLVLENAVFIDIPKCGCTSVFQAVEQYPDGNWHQRDIPDNAKHLPRFAVTRNPYDRALSMFYFERYQCEIENKSWYPGGHEAFYKFWGLDNLCDFLWMLLWNKRNQRHDRHFPNFLPVGEFLKPLEPVKTLRLEFLQADWDEIPELPRVQIGRARQQQYDKVITDKQAALIREWAGADFSTYGYDSAAYAQAA